MFPEIPGSTQNSEQPQGTASPPAACPIPTPAGSGPRSLPSRTESSCLFGAQGRKPHRHRGQLSCLLPSHLDSPKGTPKGSSTALCFPLLARPHALNPLAHWVGGLLGPVRLQKAWLCRSCPPRLRAVGQPSSGLDVGSHQRDQDW